MFEGDSKDMCAGKFLLLSMGGRAEGLACADPGARTPIGASGNYYYYYLFSVNIKPPRHRFGLGLCLGLAITMTKCCLIMASSYACRLPLGVAPAELNITRYFSLIQSGRFLVGGFKMGALHTISHNILNWVA